MSLSWIPINLPWRNYISNELSAARQLSDAYADWFNVRVLDLFGPIPDPGWSVEHIHNVLESCPALDTTDWSSLDAYNTFMEAHPDNDLRIVATRRRLKAVHNNFEVVDPECQAWLRRIEAAAERVRNLQFCSHVLCRPGVVLEIQSTSGARRRVIIGDVDASGYDAATPLVADNEVVVRCADLRPLIES